MSFNNKPVPRHQADEQQDFYNAVTALDDFPEDLARQEFRDEADINRILLRHGVGLTNNRPLVYGETDFDLNLQDAYAAVDAARAAHGRLDPQLREKYPTWDAMLTGLASGRFAADMAELKAKAEAEKAASQSDTPTN